MLFKISIKYYITIVFSLFSFVERYAVRNVKIRQYAVRRVKIRQYAVRKGEGGVTLFSGKLTCDKIRRGENYNAIRSLKNWTW